MANFCKYDTGCYFYFTNGPTFVLYMVLVFFVCQVATSDMFTIQWKKKNSLEPIFNRK